MFRPHSNSWLNNKFYFYSILRGLDTAYYSNKYNLFVITRYEDVNFVLNNPDIFSSAKGNLIVENPHRFGRTLGASDNPTHAYYKDIVKDAYSKQNIARIVQALDKALKKHFVSNSINLYQSLQIVSAYVIAEILNLPCDKDIVKDIIIDIQNTTLHALQHSSSREAHDRLTNLVKYLLDNNVEATGPGIYSEYKKAGNPNIMSLFTGPTISGMSSLVGALEFLTFDLYRTDNIKALLADRGLIPNAINESLRYNASTGRFSRTATCDTVLHNTNIPKGNRVAICLESANRDATIFNDPGSFLLDRDTSRNLAFGKGIHACIALAISKECMRVYLNHLLDTYGDYTVAYNSAEPQYIMTASGNDDMIDNLILYEAR